MNETANLVIKVNSSDVPVANKELKELTKTSATTERATDGLVASFKKMIAPLVGIAAATAAVRKLVDVTKTFQSLEAQLKTATGSVQDAKVAMEALTDFATQTPYALEQSVEGFIQLVNLGLTPSERALRSYGDIASGVGKQLTEMANAVGRAVAGEFDPLKSFGVSAKKDGDEITFAFRGVTETVKNNAAEIEGYFIRLGENNFAGAMADRMKTLEGAMSNLSDAVDQAFYAIANTGIRDIITSSFRTATEQVESFTRMIKSGELALYLEAIVFKFRDIAEAAEKGFAVIENSGSAAFAVIGETGQLVIQQMLDAIKYFPENVLALVQAGGASLGLIVAYAEAVANGVLTIFKELWEGMVQSFENVGREIKDQFLTIFVGIGKLLREFQIATAETLNKILPKKNQYSEEWFRPLREDIVRFDNTLKEVDFNFFKEQGKNLQDTFGSIGGAAKGVATDMSTATGRWVDSISEITTQNENAKQGFDDLIKKARETREAYEKEQAIIKALNDFFKEDRTARFTKAKPPGGLSDERKKEFEDLRKKLLDEEVLYQESYNRRAALINDNIALSGEQRLTLLAALDARAVVEEAKAYEDKAARLEAQYMAEQMFLQDALDNRLISEQEFQAKSKDNWSKYTNAVTSTVVGGAQVVATKQLQMHSQVLDLAANISDQLNSLAGENTSAAKALFIASKAIAIAQAIVYTELAATRALAEGGFYAGIPMATVIRALGYASVGLMAGTAAAEYQGKFEKGGMISAGRYGMVNEAGFEFIRGPAQVTSAAATRDALAGAGGGGDVNVNIINQAPSEVEVVQEQRSDGSGVDLLIRKVKQGIANDIREGGNDLSRTFERSFGLRRGNAT